MALETLVTEPWADFGLVDSGHGRKLERYGPWRFIRPEPQAMWTPATPDWRADGEFVGGSDAEGGGRWTLAPKVPPSWPLSRGGVKFWASNTPFRHLAFFPDMAPQWDWIADRIAPGDEVLNLFGYTGVASLVMAAKGARVTHVDASKKAVGAAVENQKLSGLGDAPIRWIIDDALKFVEREVRRGRRYAGIILDPPKYGRGPKGEVWELDEKLAALMSACAALLDDRSKFLVLTAYAVRLSAIAIANLTEEVTRPLGGSVQAGEMTIREEARGLLLPTAIFARWSQ
ncbi:class I SAM-dependent methyltransferase [Sphingosinicella sp.]|uniref:class I SAM-dependent methyltransferase n=1 Tax=Sphingosinicella sp. TaxID=1917971 RepID=UPI002627A75B|nr:class I SAM-dependent methyltransferase [Sphingosinicella sp.]